VAELAERIGAGEKVTIVDVRQPEETAGGVLVGARLIPLGELSTRWKELEDCDEVVCYCASGMRSQTAARQLRDWGVLNATSLEGGISAWMQYGGEVVSP
jgi:adenylyltransferase/sulfurtransferase